MKPIIPCEECNNTQECPHCGGAGKVISGEWWDERDWISQMTDDELHDRGVLVRCEECSGSGICEYCDANNQALRLLYSNLSSGTTHLEGYGVKLFYGEGTVTPEEWAVQKNKATDYAYDGGSFASAMQIFEKLNRQAFKGEA